MIQRLPLHCSVLALALLVTACSDEPALEREPEDYRVVEEGSAPGVTGTLVPPNDRTGVPPLTDTNLDTTTSFSIVGGPTATSGTTPGDLGGSLAEALPGGANTSRRPGDPVAPATRQPSPAAEPSATSPSSPRETVERSDPSPAPAAPEPRPQVVTPTPETEPVPERRDPEPRQQPEPDSEPAPPSSTTGTSTRDRPAEPEPPPPPPPPPPSDDAPADDPPPPSGDAGPEEQPDQ